MCASKFEDLSALAAPYVVDNVDLLTTNCISRVKLEKIGMFVYLVIYYIPVSDKQAGWLKYNLTKEKNICSLSISSEWCAKFVFPEHTSFITSLLINNEKELITKSIILDNVKYWKENAFLVLLDLLKCKNPGHRNVTRVLLLIFNSHDLIFLIRSFMFRIIKLFIKMVKW